MIDAQFQVLTRGAQPCSDINQLFFQLIRRFGQLDAERLQILQGCLALEGEPTGAGYVANICGEVGQPTVLPALRLLLGATFLGITHRNRVNIDLIQERLC
ncbi:hypothetical protein D3C81_1519460 [compost metagenome]